ncbi:uncharacterized protein [Lolium perenne]|uniref:uncharacterized protein isoform X2 n=1 Tax=Lolium perenne TaxID=4522 RepID=UPI0021EA7EA7|nr:uncharacterized protein LOC127311729 isoform X2 [Lolium perenne]
MVHIADPAGAVVVGCKVLPIFNENGIVDGAVKKIVHRLDGKKAVARVKELLRWASQVRPLSTSASGKKWKVLSFPGRDGGGTKCDEVSSGKLSFKWEAGSCSSVASSSVLYSPVSFASAPAARTTTEQLHTPSRNYVSRLSSVSQKSSSSSQACSRMAQWITTDSDFVVLEL